MTEKILHRAVLENDLASLRLFREDRLLKSEKDERGYTAIELARYLGKTQCLRVLREWNPNKLKIFLKNDPEVSDFNEVEIEEVLGFRYLPTLEFSDNAFFLRTLDNCPYLLKYTPLGKECRDFGKTYTSKLFAEVAVRWIDDSIQYGLFSEHTIEEGALIGEYTGHVRPLDKKNPDPNGYCVQYPTKWWSKEYTVIDASHGGNALRFVNHSDTPNLKSAWALDRDLLHLFFVAKEHIPANTQLTIDYGPDYWRHRQKL